NDQFCAPENINLDFPPDKQWMRIGVHYYDVHGQTYSVHPHVKIFCNSVLAAELGPNGYYSPEAPVTFQPSDGAALPFSNRFWLVADVAFKSGGMCSNDGCVVQPLYADPVTKTPFLTTASVLSSTLG